MNPLPSQASDPDPFTTTSMDGLSSSSSSSVQVIDLTGPDSDLEQPRLIFPSSLPTESIEIISLPSDDDEGSPEVEVMFVREGRASSTPAAVAASPWSVTSTWGGSTSHNSSNTGLFGSSSSSSSSSGGSGSGSGSGSGGNNASGGFGYSGGGHNHGGFGTFGSSINGSQGTLFDHNAYMSNIAANQYRLNNDRNSSGRGGTASIGSNTHTNTNTTTASSSSNNNNNNNSSNVSSNNMPSRRTSPSSSSSSTQVGNLLHRFFLDDSNFTEDYSNLHLEQAIEAEAIRIRQSEQRQMELQRQREQMMMQREQMMVRQREQIARQDQLQRDQLAFIINMRHPGLFGNSSNNNNSSSSSSSGSNANNNNAPSSSSSTAATATTTAATTTLPTPAPSATTGSSSALPVPGFGTGPGTRLGSRLGSGLGLGRRPEGSSYLHPLRNYFMRTPTPPHWDDFEFDDYLNAIADFAAPARRPPPPRPRSQFQHQHQHEHHHHHHHHPTRVADPFRDRPYHPNHHHAIFRQDRLRREQQERVATPRPPPTVRQGFTKTLGGDVRIICPMCRNELGHKGGPNTTLWVVMGCGHVVCEDCVENIFISKVVIKGSRRKSTGSAKSKGKEKAKSVRFLSTSPSTTSGSPEMEDDMDVDLPEQAAGAGGGGGGGGVSSSAAGGETAGGKRGSSGSSKTAEEQPAAAEEANFKLVKKATGLCPGCHRKIKKGSIQQLYL